MTKLKYIITIAVFFASLSPLAIAQTQVQTNFDLVSTYVWRGVSFSGISIQPNLEYSSSKVSAGFWGSQGIDGFQEVNTFASYSFADNFSIIITDYYLPGTSYFSDLSHAIELGTQYHFKKWNISGYYIFAGQSSVGDDVYFEGSYSDQELTFFLGAGNGWHTLDSNFQIINIGISKNDEIKINDTFSIPITTSVILNPDSEQIFVLVGIEF